MRGVLLTAVATIGIGIALNTAISALMFPASRSPWQRNLVRAVGAKQADANRFAMQSEFFSDAFAETRWITRIGDKTGARHDRKRELLLGLWHRAAHQRRVRPA
jgi:hypothetical protein